MKAIGVAKGKTEAEIFEIPEPIIKEPDDVLVEMVDVGVCGTDIDIIKNSLVDHPEHENKLILGHEGHGIVKEIGKKVTELKKGDHVVLVPRHGCGRCDPCNSGRADFCKTGLYAEAGIHKMHGYHSQLYLEKEQYLIKTPEEIADIAVLLEPFSIVEKAIMQIKDIQSRIPDYDISKEKAVVFGMGSIGMSAIAILKANNVKTYVIGRRNEDDLKVKLVKEMGASYINMKKSNIISMKQEIGEVGIIIEATGATQLVIDLIELLDRNGIYVFLGVPKGVEELCFNIKGMLNKIVRKNIVIMGSVNSQRIHFQQAIKDVELVQKDYNKVLNKIITNKYSIEQYKKAFEKEEDHTIKAVIEYQKGG